MPVLIQYLTFLCVTNNIKKWLGVWQYYACRFYIYLDYFGFWKLMFHTVRPFKKSLRHWNDRIVVCWLYLCRFVLFLSCLICCDGISSSFYDIGWLSMFLRFVCEVLRSVWYQILNILIAVLSHMMFFRSKDCGVILHICEWNYGKLHLF